jgi:acyl-CoA synthetase (AMP-forming)/AMP-acid ligase II
VSGESATVWEAFRASAARWPDNGFLCAPAYPGRDYHPDGVEFTYAEIEREAERLRTRYAAAGYGHGHRVALLCGQRPEYWFHLLALNALGCGLVPINPDYRHDEMLYQMEHSEADLAVAIDSRRADLDRVAAERAKPLPIVSFESFPERLPQPGLAPKSGAPDGDSEVALLYTSGTTGRPKACIETNFYFLNSGRHYLGLGGLLEMRPGDRLINPLPLFHINALVVSGMAMMLSGGCLIMPDRFHPRRWWRDVIDTRATILHYLGVMPPLLLNQAPSPEDRAHRIRFGAGAGIEPELHRGFEERFGFPLVELWGMTETGRIFADNVEPRMVDTRAFGRPGFGMAARVVDEEDRDVPVGAPGQLLVRDVGPEPRKGFFAGYLKNEAATEESWRGGWFHTGDVVRQDASGMLYFVDRKKNIIRRSGENVAAAEVEACLQAHPDVALVAVIPARDEVREEEVFACVVPTPGAAADAAQAEKLFAWCFERLAYYKAPGWLLFLDALPTTGTQKVQKQLIFAAGEDPRGRAGAFDLRARKKRG